MHRIEGTICAVNIRFWRYDQEAISREPLTTDLPGLRSSFAKFAGSVHFLTKSAKEQTAKWPERLFRSASRFEADVPFTGATFSLRRRRSRIVPNMDYCDIVCIDPLPALDHVQDLRSRRIGGQ